MLDGLRLSMQGGCNNRKKADFSQFLPTGHKNSVGIFLSDIANFRNVKGWIFYLLFLASRVIDRVTEAEGGHYGDSDF